MNENYAIFRIGKVKMNNVNAVSFHNLRLRETENADPKLKDKELDLQKSYIDSLKIKYSFVEATKYISKEEAGKIAKKDLGTDGSDFFEESIFPASVQITLNPNTIQSVEQIDSINKVLAKNTIIDEVKSDKEAMVTIYQSINKITFWLMIFAGIFLVIVVILINNSIRLKIYAKRFSIKTMQLVGARRRFIMKPFLVEGGILGFFAATIAIIGLSALWYTLATKVGLPLWNPNYTALILILIAIGVIIAIFSTLFAAWRYLRLKTDQLY